MFWRNPYYLFYIYKHSFERAHIIIVLYTYDVYIFLETFVSTANEK